MDKPRTDSLLHTGMSSASFAKEKVKKEVRKEQAEATQAVLKPAGELIEKEIQKIRNEISSELSNLIHVDMSKTDVKSVVLGLRLADSKFNSLSMRMRKLLTVHKKVEDAEL